MSKDISTLVDDIYHVLDSSTNYDHDVEKLAQFGTNCTVHLMDTISESTKGREAGKLWASDLGESCMRKMWYKFNTPNSAEPMDPQAYNKFLYGDVIEELTLALAEVAGHEVTHRQERYELELDCGWKVSGKSDAVIDGHMVDVKSCSQFAFKKYTKDGELKYDDDSFGYIAQISFYDVMEPSVLGKTPYFLMQDKTLGHLALIPPETVYGKDALVNTGNLIAKVVDEEATPPKRRYEALPEGKSGNMKLGVPCSYCPFKKECWPGLRTFVSSRGPLYLTEVKREPKMLEVA